MQVIKVKWNKNLRKRKQKKKAGKMINNQVVGKTQEMAIRRYYYDYTILFFGKSLLKSDK